VIAVDLEAVYMGAKLVAPYMVRQRWGRIISTSSVHAWTSAGGTGSYDAAKAGIVGLTKSLAYELAPYNVLANAIAPGFIKTGMSILPDGTDETNSEEFQSWYVRKRHIPMARHGEPSDIAGAAVFLASEYCRYLTGQLIVVDGGLTSTF
jgi:3-oxoacyl-[acyl-carrier protein] reductase